MLSMFLRFYRCNKIEFIGYCFTIINIIISLINLGMLTGISCIGVLSYIIVISIISIVVFYFNRKLDDLMFNGKKN